MVIAAFRSISGMALVALAAMLCSCAAGHDEKEASKPLIVAAAANVQFAMEELTRTFEAESGQTVEVVISSSGKLSAQISHGAPFDIFVSANMMYPQSLFDGGYAAERPRVYALGSLVFWTLKEMKLSSDPAFLSDPSVRKIAVANPRNAPYGAEALRALRHYGLLEELEQKLVYGESISQTNQYILSQACDAGITAKSVVLSPRLRGKGTWADVDPGAYKAIMQGVIVTSYGIREHPETSRLFYEFLFSDKARNILQTYGYSLPSGAE